MNLAKSNRNGEMTRFKQIANENVKHNKIIDRVMASICKVVPIAFDVCVLLEANGSECAMRWDMIFFVCALVVVCRREKKRETHTHTEHNMHPHADVVSFRNSMRLEKLTSNGFDRSERPRIRNSIIPFDYRPGQNDWINVAVGLLAIYSSFW